MIFGRFCVIFRRAPFFFVKNGKKKTTHKNILSNISKVLGLMETSISKVFRVVEIIKIYFQYLQDIRNILKSIFPIVPGSGIVNSKSWSIKY